MFGTDLASSQIDAPSMSSLTDLNGRVRVWWSIPPLLRAGVAAVLNGKAI